MSIFSSRSALISALAVLLAVLCLGGPAAHAQTGPVGYWLPNWPIGFGGNSTADQNANTYGNFPGFNGSDSRSGFSTTRYNFSNGMFVGSASSPVGLGLTGFNQIGAFGNIGSLSSQSVQFGYNFQNAPLTVYAGFNTLKYTTGIGGSPFAPFDTTSGTLPVYSVQTGVEFRPTSNLSLSLGVGVTQQSGRIDSDINSLPGATPFTGVRR
jgi:hypothetical protein